MPNTYAPLGWDGLGLDFAPQSNASVEERLRAQGFALLDAHALFDLIGSEASSCTLAQSYWNDLPPDPHLKDGGHYRKRRHGSFIHTLSPALAQAEIHSVPHRAHWQPTQYNALHGGMIRDFAPLSPSLVALPFWQPLLSGLGRLFAHIRGVPEWFIEAHQFRIDTKGGIGRPTPEGAHRDGVDFVAVIMLGRHAIRGGETRVFELNGHRGVRFTLAQTCSVLLMDDSQVIHESTPITPVEADGYGWRDTLVLTYRAGGFLEP